MEVLPTRTRYLIMIRMQGITFGDVALAVLRTGKNECVDESGDARMLEKIVLQILPGNVGCLVVIDRSQRFPLYLRNGEIRCRKRRREKMPLAEYGVMLRTVLNAYACRLC